MSAHHTTPVLPHLATGLGDPSEAEVTATLKLVLESQPFRTSRQCQDLLRYIVQHSLRGEDGSLRERILGIEVFGRATDYDTSEDPVVRMRAADVRKRLAQYYQAIEHDGSIVHIDLKPGSYRATFHYLGESRHSELRHGELRHSELRLGENRQGERRDEHGSAPVSRVALAVDFANDPPPAIDLPAITASTAPEPPAHRQNRLRLWAAAVVLVFLFAFSGWRIFLIRSLTLQQRFWAPLTRSGQPVLIYVGSNAVYRFVPEYLDQYRKTHDIRTNGPEFFVDLPKGATFKGDDLMAVKDCFVSVADLAAASGMVALLRGWDKPFNLRSAADISIGDIRNTPSVLIGGFNDTWTLETTNDLPFSFRDGVRILNRDDPAHSWAITNGEKKVADDKQAAAANGGTVANQDFALISRLQHSNTGGPVLTIGGIGSFGTQAAAEFVMSPEKMSDLLKSAPDGWESKNMQAVLRIKVVGFAPVAIDVVATKYW